MGNKWKFIIFLTFILIILVLPTKAYAHGVYINYTTTMAIEVVALFDTGEPMAGAQVLVYAPDDSTTPYLTSTCDDAGRFVFTPDQDGIWDVQVRLSGHGEWVHIPVGEGMTASDSGGGYGALQIVLMSVCVIWGLIGTALYVRRRKA
jgi:nickel transport protein